MLVQSGVHDIVFHELDSSGVLLRAVLSEAEQICAADEILALLSPRVPGRLRPLFGHCLMFPEQAQRVSDVATALGVNRRTLVNHCAAERFPPPLELIGWCRLFLAGYLLSVTVDTVESVALRLEFPSVSAFRNMVRRYTGHTATAIRTSGGHLAVLTAFERVIPAPRAAPPDESPASSLPPRSA
jgi:AraC-like DNA-binding protein